MRARALAPPESIVVGINQRRLTQDLKVDLGERFPVLQGWASRNGRLSEIYTGSTGTTIFKVPLDFTTIGPGPASIPWFITPLLGDRDCYEVAGWVHDAGARWGIPHDVNDFLFWWVARSGRKQVSPSQAYVGWLGLRAFGWMAY